MATATAAAWGPNEIMMIRGMVRRNCTFEEIRQALPVALSTEAFRRRAKQYGILLPAGRGYAHLGNSTLSTHESRREAKQFEAHKARVEAQKARERARGSKDASAAP